MKFKANGNRNYFIIWPAPPLTRNSAPTGCQATTSWFFKTLFAKLMVWLGWSWKPCVSKPLYCTTSISGNISYPQHISPLNGRCCSGMLSHSKCIKTHAGVTQRESVLPACAGNDCGNDTPASLFCHALSFTHQPHLVGRWQIRRETTILYCICMRMRANLWENERWKLVV